MVTVEIIEHPQRDDKVVEEVLEYTVSELSVIIVLLVKNGHMR